ALSALRSDTRQLAELVDQILDGSLKHVGRTSEPWHLSWCRWRCGRWAAPATSQRPQPLLRHFGDLLGSVAHRADDQVLQGLDVLRIDDLGIDLYRNHLAAAFDDDLDQTPTGLTVYLGVRELLLSFQ